MKFPPKNQRLPGRGVTVQLRLLASIAAVWLLQSACDPCFGAVPACSDEPRLVVMGRVGKYTNGRAVEGADVALVRRRSSGAVDSLSMTTDGNGYFQFDLDPDGDSLQQFDLVVRPPGLRGYRIVDLTVPLVRRRGEAYPLGMLTDRAFYTARFVNARKCAIPALKQDGSVAIRRVSGPAFIINGTKVDTFTIQLNSDGEAVLPAGLVETDSVARLVGTARTSAAGERLAAGFRLDPVPYFQQRPSVVLSFAPESTFVACVIHRASAAPLGGITLDFTRTGGAPTARSTATATTDSLGRAILDLGPLEPGDVIGDVTVHGFEASSTYVVRNVAVAAADGFLAGRIFGVGLGFPYFGLVTRFNAPLPNVHIMIQRTGGIDVRPDSITAVTGADGRFNASVFQTTSLGDLIVSLTVTPPAPLPAFRIDNVHLPAMDGDPQGILFIGIDVDHPPPGSTVLTRRSKVGRH